MFMSLVGKLIGLTIASSVMLAGMVSAIMGIRGVFMSESFLSWAVSSMAMSGGLTTILIGGFGVALVGPKLTDF